MFSTRSSHTPDIRRQGEWGKLGHQGATATKQGLLSVVTESRNRHSVLQVAVPLELDTRDAERPRADGAAADGRGRAHDAVGRRADRGDAGNLVLLSSCE